MELEDLGRGEVWEWQLCAMAADPGQLQRGAPARGVCGHGGAHTATGRVVTRRERGAAFSVAVAADSHLLVRSPHLASSPGALAAAALLFMSAWWSRSQSPLPAWRVCRT